MAKIAPFGRSADRDSRVLSDTHEAEIVSARRLQISVGELDIPSPLNGLVSPTKPTAFLSSSQLPPAQRIEDQAGKIDRLLRALA